MKQKGRIISFNSVSLSAVDNKKEILNRISGVIQKGEYLNGNETKKLEAKLSKLLGNGYATTTASGHDSLLLALASLHLQKDDEVIFPVNSYPTAFPVCLSGAKAIPVDVAINGQIDIEKLKQKITPKTKAVVLVHLYGLIGNIQAIVTLLKAKHIVLIEDCAQSFGSFYKDRPVGTFGDIACFSFYPTKNLGTLGDGGGLYTKHKRLYDFFLQAKSYGEKKRYQSEFLSGHSRLPEIQAAILYIYLKTLTRDFLKRKKIATYYKKKIKEKSLLPFVRVLTSDPQSDPVLHLFVIEAKRRDKLMQFLQRRGIPTLIHYPYPIHLLPAFKQLGLTYGDFPTAEGLAKSILSLPFHQYLSKREIDVIVNALKEFYLKHKLNP